MGSFSSKDKLVIKKTYFCCGYMHNKKPCVNKIYGYPVITFRMRNYRGRRPTFIFYFCSIECFNNFLAI